LLYFVRDKKVVVSLCIFRATSRSVHITKEISVTVKVTSLGPRSLQ
jgi:hypothetical protein